jgi:hypothetical protein
MVYIITMKEWVKPVVEVLAVENTFGVCTSTTPGKTTGTGDIDFPDDCTPTS